MRRALDWRPWLAAPLALASHSSPPPPRRLTRAAAPPCPASCCPPAQAIQFSKAGTLKLPLLDLTPPWGSPIRPVQAAAVSAALEGFSAARGQPERLVAPDTCWVVVLYGRVFCAHHDRGAGLLRLYRMFRCGSAADAGPLLPR